MYTQREMRAELPGLQSPQAKHHREGKLGCEAGIECERSLEYFDDRNIRTVLRPIFVCNSSASDEMWLFGDKRIDGTHKLGLQGRARSRYGALAGSSCRHDRPGARGERLARHPGHCKKQKLIKNIPS